LTRADLERTQREKLLGLLSELRAANPFYREKLAASGVSPAALATLPLAELLDRLPFTTREELEEDQGRHPPFGTNLSAPAGAYTRLHQTSGTRSGRPLRWLDTRESWEWLLRQWDVVYGAAGVGPADRIFFPFSFGPFLGFWGGFDAAWERGSLALPGGGMRTATRLRFLLETGATVVCTTPTYALHMAEAARSEGIDLARSAVRALIAAGEPGASVPAVRARIERAWGARLFDHHGMTEIGPLGYECLEAPGGMHAIEEEFIVEVRDRESGERLEAGEGELVVTSLGRRASPVLRYRTGDLVRWSLAPCACGSARGRFEGGILARVDDMVSVRGMNLYPAAIEGVIRAFDEVAEYRVRVLGEAGARALEVEVEVEPAAAPGGESGGAPTAAPDGAGKRAAGKPLAARVAAAIERTFLFRAEVREVPPGTLPRFELKGGRFIIEPSSSA
jgi:phenylacetate-CoA ligase